jgi:AraC-like DNA-binding protein
MENSKTISAVPALEHLTKTENESFVYRNFEYDFFPTPWHYHPEFEIVLVTSSTGKRHIGNHVGDFGPGNLCFIGCNIPHTYKSDEKYYHKKKQLKAKSIVIHFSLDTFGDSIYLPEFKPILSFLKNYKRAFDITGIEQEKISDIMRKMQYYKPLKRWYALVQILEILSMSDNLHNIVQDEIEGFNPLESMRLLKVFEFVKDNYHRSIKIASISALVHMTETSFSRFFIQRTRRSFTDYLVEYRLSKAQKLILETEENIENIAMRTGFNNLSNFNRHFKKKFGVTPRNCRTAKFKIN